jgi:hypothetical protein
MDESSLRKTLLELMNGGSAYPPIKDALAGLKAKNRAVRPCDGPHSIWEELEHMRIAQEDILRYTLDSEWKSPNWPGGYWPDPNRTPTAEMWNSSVKHFFADLNELKSIVKDRARDLTAEIPHGEGRTYLREIILAADHNSYHTGQIIYMRKLLGDWKV